MLSKPLQLVVCALSIATACTSTPSDAPVAQRAQALNVDLWLEGGETAAPPPLPASDVSHAFEHVNGSNSTSSTTFAGRTSGPTGTSGVVHSGTWSVHVRGNGQHPNTAIPTYTGEVRKRLNTMGHSNVRLTYWRRLVGFEASILNGAVGYDRFVVRYSTAAEPGPSDWTEAHAVTNGAGGVWTEGVVENLPAASTLWISFQADLRPRLNTAISPSVYQFDEWIYLDDFRVTGDTGCTSNAECADASACTTDTCNVATGACEHAAVACSDGLFCNGVESCDALSGCVAGTAPEIDDASACTTDSCDEDNDVVVHTAIECNDGLFCNGTESCDAATGCIGGVPPALDDGVLCTTDSCDEDNDLVVHAPRECDDGIFCNGTEFCHPTVGCATESFPSLHDLVACTIDSCDEDNDIVVHAPNDAACDDANACTVNSCHPTSGCVSIATPGLPCPEGLCTDAGTCMPYEPTQCYALEEHAPCGEGASWCEGSACVLSPACGDGWLNTTGVNEPVEECDDGNKRSDDACSASCESQVLRARSTSVTALAAGERRHALGADAADGMMLVAPAGGAYAMGSFITQAGQRASYVPYYMEPTELLYLESVEGRQVEVVGLPDGRFAIARATEAPSVLLLVVERDGTISAGYEHYPSSIYPGSQIYDVRIAVAGDQLILACSQLTYPRGPRFPPSVGLPAWSFPLSNLNATPTSVSVGATSVAASARVALAGAADGRWAIAWTSGASSVALRTFWPEGSSATRTIANARTPVLTALPDAPDRARYALAWSSTTDGYARALEVAWDTAGFDVAQQRRVTASTNGVPEVFPSIAAFGSDAFMVGFALGADTGQASVRLLQRGSTSAGSELPEADEVLAEHGFRGDVALTSIDRGVWMSWIGDVEEAAVLAYLLEDPSYRFEPDMPGCSGCEAYDACGDSWVSSGETCDHGDVELDRCSIDCLTECDYDGTDDSSCNNVDNDCDGRFDEGFVDQPVSCGVGVCATVGILDCDFGYVHNTCGPNPPNSSTDAYCNGDDDDCDGRTDEDYAATSTSCGVGACATSGQLQCSNGTISNNCAPLPQPSATDALCDGIDEDCDGAVDESCACTQATATVAAHLSASRAFACSSTPVSFFSEGFESGTLSGWTTAGNASGSTALAHVGSYSAQLAGTGVSTLRRTISTAGLSTATLSLQVRTRGPSSAGYNPAIRHSVNGGSTWTTLASHPGPLPSWGALSFNTLPINASLTLSLEASPTETTRFVHYDAVNVTGTCATPAWFASGSNAQLGTLSGASVTLYNLHSEPGVWRSGSCPVLP